MGLILCAKPGEGAIWKRNIEKVGRSRDLIYFAKGEDFFFNPLLYENSRGGEGAGETLNLVDMIMNIHLLGKNFMAGTSSGGGDAFWEIAMRRLISRCIDLLKLAGEPITFMNIRKIVVSAFTPEEIAEYKKLMNALDDPESPEKQEETENKIAILIQEKYCLNCIIRASQKEKTEEEEDTFNLVNTYFNQEFAFLSDRTRSSIEEHLYGLLEPFTGGILKKYFSSTLSPELWPEVTYRENAIVVIDFSVKEFGVAGIYAQGILKYIWQQAMERRRPDQDGYTNPVFLWVDEAQYFINPNYDTLFQTTARSSLVCTVYLTQSLNNYILMMGRHSPGARARALLANFGTKIYHANTAFETNKMASDIIGYHVGVLASMGGQIMPHQAGSISEQLLLQVQPNEFVTLKYGRKENDNIVEAYIIKTGPWRYTKDNFIKVEFKQD